MLRIQLISNSLGPLIIDKNDPIDIQNLIINIKRSEKKQGIVYTALLNVEFIEEGRDFLQQAFETDGGIDAIVGVNIYEYDDKARIFKLRFECSANFESYDLGEINLIINVNQSNFQMLVDSFSEVDIDLESVVAQNGLTIPPADVKNVTLHSKTILVQDRNIPDTFLDFQQGEVFIFTIPNGLPGSSVNRDNMVYMEMSNSGEVDDNTSDDYPESFEAIGGQNLMEIPESFHQPFEFVDWNAQLNNGYNPGTTANYITFLTDPTPVYRDIRFPKVEFTNGGTTKVDLRLTLQFTVDIDMQGGVITGGARNLEAKMWFEHRDRFNNVKFIYEIGSWGNFVESFPGPVLRYTSDLLSHIFQDSDIDVSAGDKFYIYGTVRHYGEFDQPIAVDCIIHHTLHIQAFDGTFINIEQKSVAQPSQARMVLLYEAFQQCVRYITGQADCFKSTLLGRTDLGYAADGLCSLIAYSNGNNIRGKKAIGTDNPFPILAQLNELYNFINMVTPVGLGFERDAKGQNIVVLEPIQYFYDSGTTIIDLGPIEGVRKKVNKDRYFNQVEIGYSTKMDVKEINAIDEFNTLRRFKLPIANSKNQLTITTPLIASGYIIETQRRFVSSTKDSKYDDGKFVVSLVRDGDNFKSKKNEGYAEITGLFDSSTAYNLDLSPARCLQNWFPVLSCSLVYCKLSKVIRFTYGEFNFTMSTRKTGTTVVIEEDGQFDISSVLPLWDNLDYILDAPLSMEQLALIESNPKGKIQFQDGYGNVMAGYISTEGIKYTSDEESEFTLMKTL